MKRLAYMGLMALLVGCSSIYRTAPVSPEDQAAQTRVAGIPIKHVIIIIQENRTPDNLFRGLPGADTIPPRFMHKIGLVTPYDLPHSHRAFERNRRGHWDPHAFAYVDPAEAAPYLEMARNYAFGDRMFQSNEGPSFPAHQYLISGTSLIHPDRQLKAAENPHNGLGIENAQGGCDAAPSASVELIDRDGKENRTTFPCFERPTLMDLISQRGLAWRYYQEGAGPGLWHAPDAIQHLRNAWDYSSNVLTDPHTFLSDVTNGHLAAVSWITPSMAESDHALVNTGGGPAWVREVVNTIGRSQYWDSSAIFIVWDDWGGWYDHVPPPIDDAYELGFRVPLIVISAYTPKGYVSHRQHEFGSILKFTEKVLDLGSLGTTDQKSDDLMDCFQFKKPQRFRPIR